MVRRVRVFFLEFKHDGRNGVGGVEISKIRHLGPKQRCFSFLVQNDIVLVHRRIFLKLKLRHKTMLFWISYFELK